MDNDATNEGSTIVLEWDPPSNRNGPYRTLITYSATQVFNYNVSRVQNMSGSFVIDDEGTRTHTLSGNDILPFANYNITITPFNRLFGQSLSAPNVFEMIMTVPIGRWSLL